MPVCTGVYKNYFYDTCIKDGSIIISIKKPLPKGSNFYLKALNENSKKIEDLSSRVQEEYIKVCNLNHICEFKFNLEHTYINMGLYDKSLGIYNLKGNNKIL